MARISVAEMLRQIDKGTMGDDLERIPILLRDATGQQFEVSGVSVATFRDGAETNHEVWLVLE